MRLRLDLARQTRWPNPDCDHHPDGDHEVDLVADPVTARGQRAVLPGGPPGLVAGVLTAAYAAAPLSAARSAAARARWWLTRYPATTVAAAPSVTTTAMIAAISTVPLPRSSRPSDTAGDSRRVRRVRLGHDLGAGLQRHDHQPVGERSRRHPDGHRDQGRPTLHRDCRSCRRPASGVRDAGIVAAGRLPGHGGGRVDAPQLQDHQ